MRETPTGLPEGTKPRYTIAVYQDPHGHWFASGESCRQFGATFIHTATFTTAVEAIAAVVVELGADVPAVTDDGEADLASLTVPPLSVVDPEALS